MKMQFSIRGMHCTACAASIERNVRKLDGADNVYVNFAAALLSLECDPEKLSAELAAKKLLSSYWFCTAAAQGYPSGVSCSAR